MIVLYILVIVLAVFFLYKYSNFSKQIRRPPGPKGLPVIGCIFEIKDDMLSKLCEYAEEYGEIFGMKLLGKYILCLNSEGAIRNALTNESYKQHTNNRGTFFVAELLMKDNKGVTFHEDPYSNVYCEMRKGMVKGLHVYGGDGTNQFETMIYEELERLNNQIESFKGEEFDAVPLFKRSLTNVMSLVLGGEMMSDNDKDLYLFWDMIDSVNYFTQPSVNKILSAFPILRFAPKYRVQYNAMCRGMTNFYDRYLKDRQKRGADEPKGLVDYLLDLQKKSIEEGTEVIFTNERIRSIAVETILAGISTTLSVLPSTILCLTTHPEIQEKVYKELDGTFERTCQPTLADKHKCPYLEAVEFEVHRLLTVIPLMGGRVCTKDIDFEGYDIEKGTWILLNLWHMHHNPKIWGDPWTFRPERFLDDDGQLLPRDHVLRRNLMPFGVGRRQCVGEQFARSRYFLFMSTLLRRWKFVGRPDAAESFDPKTRKNMVVNTTLMPTSVMCTAERRQ